MKIRDLSIWESFYWVGKESSFTRAASRLRIGNPQLTKRISSLEEELGTRLFHRTTRKVTLTQDGKAIFAKVQTLIEDAESLETAFESGSEPSGTIRMSCVTAFAHQVLAPLLTRFMNQYPGIEIELEPTDQLIDLIDAGMDLAIRVQEPEGADHVFKKLLENQLVLCASPAYLRNKPEIRKPEDLKLHRLLSLARYEECGFSGSGIKLGAFQNRQFLRSESGLLLTRLALEGAGVAVRSKWDVQRYLHSGKLVQVLKKHPLDPFGTLYAVIPTRRLVSHRVRIFLDFLTREIHSLKL